MKLWFSIFDRNDYNGSEPCFLNPDDYYFSKIISDNYDIISDELTVYLQQHELEGYFNKTMVAKENTWKTISLKWWGMEIYKHHKYFPKTQQIINSIPGLVSASFNLLEPNGHIVPHYGDTNGIFRCHFGLSIPGKIPDCGFRVKNEWRSWENGKLLVFVDANNHEAINNTNQNRYIFLFDIIREEFIRKKRSISAIVVTGLFLQKMAEKIKTLYGLPVWIRKIFAYCLIPFAYVAIPIRNFIFRVIE